MLLPAFQRAARRIRDRLGADALLRGSVATRVPIEHGVRFDDPHQGSFERTVVTVDKALAARSGDTLVYVDLGGVPIAGESYVIDSPAFEDNGASQRFVVRKVA